MRRFNLSQIFIGLGALLLTSATAPPASGEALDLEQLPAEQSSVPETKKLPLGQLLIVGFKGTTLKEGLGEVIRETKPGAILIFGRNVRSARQISLLNHAAQDLSMKVSKSPLLIAIDQEGGNVIRIRHTPTLPSALAIGRTRDLAIAKKSGVATGRLLKALGINVNLAPVVDVSDPNTDRFLGTRTFGNDANMVSEMTTAVAQGLQEMNILPVAKHFPGHGNASGDSHLVAAFNYSTLEELSKRDLVPYHALAKSMKRPWGIMLAHVAFPAIDPESVPATFSKAIITGLLRQSVSHSPLVITDDIEMAGAAAEKSVGQRAVRAIAAGADMVMIAWSRNIQREVLQALEEAVESGKLSRSRVEEALERIQAVKRAYVPPRLRLATHDELRKNLLHRDFSDLGDAVVKAAVRNRRERRPAEIAEFDKIRVSNDPIIVLSSRLDFISSFRNRAVGHKVKSYQLRPSKMDEITRALRAQPESPILVYVSGGHIARYVSKLSDDLASRMLLVNVETAASIGDPKRYRDVFDVHFRHPQIGATAAEFYLDLNRTTVSRHAEPDEDSPKSEFEN